MLTRISASLPIEIIVVDNQSTATSRDYIQSQFPNINFIISPTNIGYGQANNLGVQAALSDYILILNPDTIISEKTILDTIDIFNHDSTISAIGVRMIDGAGDFLPESRRGFPDIASSLYKLIGLHHLFPKSSTFNQYYLGQQSSSTDIEVLAGACFFIRKTVYHQIGGFDPRYFMYGEDIDLSYQMHINGHRIYYYEANPIVHFKGKSSVKKQWKYQREFYHAMKLYWDKNLNQSQSIIRKGIIYSSVTLLQVLSWVKQLLISCIYPILDFLCIYSSIAGFAMIWQHYVKQTHDFFPTSFFTIALPVYTLGWMGSLFVNHLYEDEIDIGHIINGTIMGLFTLLIIYFLLPINFKYSRAIILFGCTMSFVVPLLIRWVGYQFFDQKVTFRDNMYLRGEFIPTHSTHQTAFQNLVQNYSRWHYIPTADTTIQIYDISQTSPQHIIDSIANQQHNVWLYSPNGQYAIECQGQHRQGYIIAPDTNFRISSMTSHILKRMFDISASIKMLLFFPFLFIFCQKSVRNRVFSFLPKVLLGTYSWLSVTRPELRQQYHLRPGVWTIDSSHPDIERDYLRHFSIKWEVYYWMKNLFGYN